jgi:hypothetical protein
LGTCRICPVLSDYRKCGAHSATSASRHERTFPPQEEYNTLINLGNFLRTLVTPEPIKDWSLTSLKEKLIKIGAKVVSHGLYVAFQMAEVAILKNLFADILRMIAELRPPPDPTPA